MVFKPTTYESYLGDKPWREIVSKQVTPFIKKLYQAHCEHYQTLEHVEKVLRDLKLKFHVKKRGNKIKTQGYDLVITVGGDGTFLRVSHRVKNIPLLGVNSAPSMSVGALCSLTLKNFKDKIEKIILGKAFLERRRRLLLTINDHLLSVRALNDVLFTNVCPAGTSRYFIECLNKKEEQKSSGIWISTPLGSTAAMQAAGGVPMAPNAKNYQYHVREPYGGSKSGYKLLKGLLPANRPLIITNLIMDASLYIDGMQEIHHLKFGDQVRFDLSEDDFLMIV